MHFVIKKRLQLVLLLALAISISACSSARINQFDKFAVAGVKFTESIPTVLDEAFEVSVKHDSMVLNKTRNVKFDAIDLEDEDEVGRTSIGLLRTLRAQDDILIQRRNTYNDISRHADLLKSYFLALKALAKTDGASAISDSTGNLVDSLGKLDSKITSVGLGDLPLKDAVQGGSKIAVAAFQSRALNQELEAHSKIIESELVLMESILDSVAEIMTDELGNINMADYKEKIQEPYASPGNLPANWSARRQADFKRRTIQLRSINAARNAANKMRTSFVALVENRLDDEAIALLIQDLDNIVTLAEGISGD